MRVCDAVSEVRVMKHLDGCSASVALLKYGLHQGEAVMLLEPCTADLEGWRAQEARTPRQCIRYVSCQSCTLQSEYSHTNPFASPNQQCILLITEVGTPVGVWVALTIGLYNMTGSAGMPSCLTCSIARALTVTC